MRRMYSENQIANMPKDIATLVDAEGHNRFIEGDIPTNAITGISYSYAKWSLSGSHLMLIIAGNIADTTVITAGQFLCTALTLPEWIYDKLVAIYSNVVSQAAFNCFASDGTTQALGVYLRKISAGRLDFMLGSLTLTKDRSFRVYFDLLIDAE